MSEHLVTGLSSTLGGKEGVRVLTVVAAAGVVVVAVLAVAAAAAVVK